MEKIYIVQPLEYTNNSKIFFDDFNLNYNYLSEIELNIITEETYDQYSKDIASLNQPWTAKAEIIDPRGLESMGKEPVRLLLSRDFFNSDINEQKEIILHEIGHYMTNPPLIDIRKFIAKENPITLAINDPNLNSLIEAHNKGLYYIFQIPKLIQELNAELWVYENEPSFSKTRLQLYCKTINEFIEDSRSINNFSNDFFYNIPKLNFLILWREAIIKHTKYDFSEQCIKDTKLSFEILKKLSNKCRIGEIKLLTLKDEILNAVEYKNENIEKIKKIYAEIFEEYIYVSSFFFPKEDQVKIRSLYNV